MHKPLVSVIVPVYNVEKYLRVCLDSIITQSYKNLEVICVNDGTQDGSEKIIDDYVLKDSRVKKVNQKNSGLNMARAAGFKHSAGDYITFVDSDDAIHTRTIETALKNILDTHSEIAVFGFKEFNKAVGEIKPTLVTKKKVLTTKEQILRYLLVNDPDYINQILQLTVWGKLYKRDIVKKVDWKKSNYRQHEDLFWTPLAFNEVSENICLNKSELYLYRRDPTRDVLSRATADNTLNGSPVGYLEIVHNFSVLMSDLLGAARLKDMLKREFEDAVYGMYRVHLGDLVDKNAVESENNTHYIDEYYRFSEQHIANLVYSLNAQDHHIKTQNEHIEVIDSRLRDMGNKLNPSSASIKFLLIIMLKAFKHRVRKCYNYVVGS